MTCEICGLNHGRGPCPGPPAETSPSLRRPSRAAAPAPAPHEPGHPARLAHLLQRSHPVQGALIGIGLMLMIPWVGRKVYLVVQGLRHRPTPAAVAPNSKPNPSLDR